MNILLWIDIFFGFWIGAALGYAVANFITAIRDGRDVLDHIYQGDNGNDH